MKLKSTNAMEPTYNVYDNKTDKIIKKCKTMDEADEYISNKVWKYNFMMLSKGCPNLKSYVDYYIIKE